MKLNPKYFVSVFLTLALLAGWTASVYASPTTVQASLAIDSVLPNVVYTDTPTTITITGTGFDPQAVVTLVSLADQYVFTPTSNSDTQLTVLVTGVPASVYTVFVFNSTVAFARYDSLTVADPVVIPTATLVPPSFVRPQMVIKSYKANVGAVQSGQEFKINIGFDNAGTANAYNVQAVFASADLVPTKTGGVAVVGSVAAGGHGGASQTFLAVDSLYGKSIVIVDVTLTYYDESGTTYSDKFTLSIPAAGGSGGVAYPTSTPTGVNTAQLVITSYAATVNPLQPGELFDLAMTVQNMGNTKAQHVTMIVGGGSSGDSSGTPQPGGVSGGSGEFTNFAPVGASNIQSLGDIPAGGRLQVKQSLIVNVSTAPGAYPMKITFSYVNDKGEVVNDDQVITLLVYSLPNLDVSFYRVPDPLFVGQPGALPIQVVNLGKRLAVLGNMTIESSNGTLESDSTLVGALDAGGYFTFDASLTPDSPGPLQLTLTINYTDDFNQPRTVERTLDLTVEDASMMPTLDPAMSGGGGGEVIAVSDETFLQKAWRFVLGLLGLDSAGPENNVPVDGAPSDGVPVPVKPGGGGGGKG